MLEKLIIVTILFVIVLLSSGCSQNGELIGDKLSNQCIQGIPKEDCD